MFDGVVPTVMILKALEIETAREVVAPKVWSPTGLCPCPLMAARAVQNKAAERKIRIKHMVNGVEQRAQ